MRINPGFHDSVNDRVDREHQARETMPFGGAVFAKVFSPDGDSERVTVETITGEKKTSFAYPFSSRNAWIRGQPENTTTMLTLIGADTKDLTPVGYYDPAKSAAARTYRSLAAAVRQNPGNTVPNKALAYRTLSPGELDISSLYAQAYFGMRDVAQLRGGLSHQTMTSMYARVETPLFQVEGPAHTLDANLRDEIRFGTIRRSKPNQSNPTLPSLVRGEGVRRAGTPGAQTLPLFAKEFSVLLDWMGDPEKLIDHRQGIVTDDDGSFPKGGPGRKPLRARYRWFSAGTPGSLNFTTSEVDEAGNVLFETSPDSSRGIAIVIPDGDFVMETGATRNGQWSVTTHGDAQFNTKNGSQLAIVVDDSFRINARQRGEITAKRGLKIKSQGFINIDAEPGSGITLGNAEKTKYPVLVANPDYLSTLNNYYSSQSALASTLATAAGNAAAAWSATGPLLMLLDPSGTVMGTCLNAASAMSQVAFNAPEVATAIGQHLPKLARMPSGFVSEKTVSQ